MSNPSYIIDVKPGCAYTFRFTNYKAQEAQRHVIARALQWGGTAWHPELQFFLDAFDIDKLEPRSFPLKEIELGTFRLMTDAEVDVAFTKRLQAAKEEGIEEGKASVEQS